MKIFEISNATNYSGGVAQMIFLSDTLSKKNGFDISVICPPNSEIYRRSCAKKIVVDMGSQISAAVKLAKIVASEKPDIIHCHHPTAHNIALIASYFVKIPVIMATRRVSFPIPKLPFYLLKYRLKKNKKLIAVSEKIKQNLLEIGVKPSKLTVIHSGTDCDKFNPNICGEEIRKEFNIPNDVKVICKIANYSYWKGFNYFLDACKTVAKDVDKIHFLIVGYQTNNAELLKEVKDRRLEHKTTIAGFRDDIPQIIAASNILINASIDGEGISGAIREALAMEKSVVATNIGGNEEIVKNYGTGILIEPKNSSAISEAIMYFIKNPDEVKEMGKNGRKTVLENFSVNAMVSKHEKLYGELMNGKS